METRTDGRPGWIEFTRAGVHILAKGDDRLRDRLASAVAAAGGDPLPEVLTDELTVGGMRQAPDFAIVDETDGRVLVRGAARVLLTSADETTREVVAPVRAPWIDEDIDGDTAMAVLSTGEAEPVPIESVSPSVATPEPMAPAAGALASAHPQFVDGHLVSARVAPVPPAESSGAGMDTDSDDAAHSAGGADDGPGSSTGVLPLTGVAPEASEPEQPPVTARLVLPTGESVDLDRGVLLGRAPRATAGIGVTGEPHLVRVASPDNEISRSHVEVYPEGPRIIVRDLGSTNGTTLASSDGPPRRMAPGEPQQIEPGTTIRLAGQASVVVEVD